MATFRYKVVTQEGSLLEGEMASAEQEDVVSQLQEMGYTPIRVEEVAVASGKRSFLSPSTKVGQQEIAAFTREMTTLLQAGLPLDRCLDTLLSLSPSESMRTMLTQVQEDVRGGAPLSKAMEAREQVFSRFYLNMIRAGEAGGSLDDVMQRLSEFMERAEALRETVKSALIYPAILVSVSVLSIVVLLMFVVPQFQQMFEESGKALPLATQVVVAAGDFVRNQWWVILLVVMGCWWLMQRQLANHVSRRRWDGWFLRLPLIGDLVAKVEVARFTRTLGTLLGNGVALLTALSIVRETMGNRVLAEGVGDVADALKEGHGLGKPLMDTGLFPDLSVHMVMVGEETGQLKEMLIKVADVYDREVESAVKRMLALMEPILILGLGLVIGGIIMSILVAILSVNDLAL
ncbi:MAG: type II secretion system F family protein [Mariprofundaceae bacterium]